MGKGPDYSEVAVLGSFLAKLMIIQKQLDQTYQSDG